MCWCILEPLSLVHLTVHNVGFTEGQGYTVEQGSTLAFLLGRTLKYHCPRYNEGS